MRTTRRRRSAVLPWLVVALALVSAPRAVCASARHADDRLVVQAEFTPGESTEWFPWRVSIHDDGIVDVDTPEAVPDRQVPRLEGRQIQSLLTRIDKVLFEQLDAAYVVAAGDGGGEQSGGRDMLHLRARTREGYHEVSVEVPAYASGLSQALSEHARREEVERFLKVWVRVLRNVRAPNLEQTRKLYRPESPRFL